MKLWLSSEVNSNAKQKLTLLLLYLKCSVVNLSSSGDFPKGRSLDSCFYFIPCNRDYIFMTELIKDIRIIVEFSSDLGTLFCPEGSVYYYNNHISPCHPVSV